MQKFKTNKIHFYLLTFYALLVKHYFYYNRIINIQKFNN